LIALLNPFAPAYMQRALLGVLLLSVLAAVCGVHVVLRRLAFATDVMSHTVFPGVVIAFALRQSLLVGALAGGVLTAVLLTGSASLRRVGEDATLAIMLTSFFAVGVVLVSRQRTYASDLTAFLFGRVLTIDRGDLIFIGIVTAVGVSTLALLHKELVMRAFDRDGAEALGYSVPRLDLVLNLVMAGVMVAALKVVGTALAVALLITPAATARLVTDRVVTAMAVAAAVAAGSGVVGLALSYELSLEHDVRLAAGATVVSVMTVVFSLVLVGARIAGARPRLPLVSER